MVSLSGVVAIAASGAAIFIVFGVVSIVVWVRMRKERHALRVLGLKQGEYSRSLQTFTGNTLTELSHEEGTALRAHGQLPYGKPTEWGQLASRETLLRPKNSLDSSFPLVDKARSLRNSLRRTRSKRLSRSSHKRMSSMATVSEIQQPSPPRPSVSREDIPLSAIEGVLELPAERTPNQTPEMNQGEEEGFILGMRPVSPGWPLPIQKDRSGLFPVLENRNSQDMFDPPPRIYEESPQRLRGGSITSQRAGTIPEDVPPPPPPAAWPPDRLSYARNDSTMRLSSMSLDTCNSSILDDARFGMRSADTEMTSPIFPSGGSFVPFSANDVGVKNGRRSFIAANTAQGMPPLHNFPIRSSSTAEHRRRSSMEPMEPRRSMTTASRNPSNASDRFGGPPHRSDSMSSNIPTRHSSFRSGTPISMASFHNPNTPNWRSPPSQMAYVPHFSQFQRSNIYDEQRENDPFYGGSPHSNGTLFSSMGSPGTTAGSMPPSPVQRSSLSQRGVLPSALKGSNSQRRKGHRRQNCVRISIHPPMTFGGSTFSPTVEEEPEDLDAMEEVDLRESAINGPSKPQPVLTPNVSPMPISKRGSRRTKPAASTLGPLAEEPQSVQNITPCKKKNNAPGDKAPSDKIHGLPDLFTALPPSAGLNLSHTPSPDRTTAVWSIPEVPSPTYDSSPGTGSPRRTAVKGPRSQPGKQAHGNSAQIQPKPVKPLMGVGSPTGLPLITGTQGSDWRKSTDSLFRTNTDAADGSSRRSRDLQGSLSKGIGGLTDHSSPASTKRGRSNTVRDRVTIWEDANRSASPPKPPAAHFPGLYSYSEASPTHKNNSGANIPRSISRNENSPSLNGNQRMPPTPTSTRRGMTTPTGKALGLGIGGTPASLYDGDGFLRE